MRWREPNDVGKGGGQKAKFRVTSAFLL